MARNCVRRLGYNCRGIGADRMADERRGMANRGTRVAGAAGSILEGAAEFVGSQHRGSA